MTRAGRGFRPEEILRALEGHGVRYVLIGGLAAAAHGSPHLTVDLDICPDRSPGNIERLAAALRELGARVRVPGGRSGRKIPLEPDLLALGDPWNFVTTGGELDVCFVPSGTGGYGDLARSATVIEVRGIRVPTASLADVIRSKEAADRPKDRAVIDTLRELLAATRRPRRPPHRSRRRGRRPR